MDFGQYSTFAFVDVETTGTSASQDRVLELGVLRVENGKLVGKMNTLLDPDVYIPPEITMITGIKSDDILSAPHFSDVADELEALLEGAVFVAHNARFDYAFIKHEFRRLGLPFNKKTLCTVKLSRLLYPEFPRHNLDAIIQFLKVDVKNRHRAFDDAQVLFEFLSHIHTSYPKPQALTAIEQLLKTPSLPSHISKKEIEELPEGPGVYLMYGENDTLLYVGKSVDIKSRVLSHFYNDFDSQTDLKLSREVKRIEALPMAGDLGASIHEASLIKTKLPIYNRALRRYRGLLAAVETEVNGYLTIEIKELSDVPPTESNRVLSVASSKKQLHERMIETAKEHKLCLKLLGLEKGKGACFGTQIGLCNGACTGDELPFKYNVRFIEAFGRNRIESWPFPGAIGIREAFEEFEEMHIINNWCYIGSLMNKSDSIENVEAKTLEFDWDNYKILKRFVTKHAKSGTITHLSSLDVHSFPKAQQ